MSHITFPGESQAYRTARSELLKEEIALKAQIEMVAALRRQLPPGGLLEKEYEFDEMAGGVVRKTKLTDLFSTGKPSLIVYSLMFDPSWDNPCRMCVSFLDGLSGNVPHLEQNLNFVVVAKAPIERLTDLARRRGWSHFSMLSSGNNDYNVDYHAEDQAGEQWPMCNVFVKQNDEVRHFYGSELFYASTEGHPRHMDMMWPLWNLLDLTPQGRNENWMPDLTY